MRFGFLAKHRGIWPVVSMCEVLDVSRSGFYACSVGRGANAARMMKCLAAM